MTELYKREFGDHFDLGITIPSCMEDRSYRNDVCPSFSMDIDPEIGLRLELWVDYPDPSSREIEGSNRYVLLIRNDQTEESFELWTENNPVHFRPIVLAIEYSSAVIKALGEKISKARQYDQAGYPRGECISNEECDTRQLMHAAWDYIYGIEYDIQQFEHVQAVGEAEHRAIMDWNWLDPSLFLAYLADSKFPANTQQPITVKQ